MMQPVHLPTVTLLIILIMLTSNPVWGDPQLIRCVSPGKSEIMIALNAKQKFKRMLNCISGDFVEDMESCAPSNAFGLSYPTGSASLARVVDRLQDTYNHLGGVTENDIHPDSIIFNGWFSAPGDSIKVQWHFAVNRLDGTAVLRYPGVDRGGGTNWDEPAKPDVHYTCNKVEKRF
jgi:hypothetical protein